MQQLISTGTDGNFSRNVIYLEWAIKLRNYVSKILGLNFKTRMYAYERGGCTYLAVDFFGSTSHSSISVTICLSGDTTELNSSEGDELYIEVPGIIDALTIVRQLLNPSKRQETSIPGLWLLSADI